MFIISVLKKAVPKVFRHSAQIICACDMLFYYIEKMDRYNKSFR